MHPLPGEVSRLRKRREPKSQLISDDDYADDSYYDYYVDLRARYGTLRMHTRGSVQRHIVDAYTRPAKKADEASTNAYLSLCYVLTSPIRLLHTYLPTLPGLEESRGLVAFPPLP